MASATCPACGTQYRISDSAAGKRATCKKCGCEFQVPVAESAGDVELLPEFEKLSPRSAAEVPRPSSRPDPRPSGAAVATVLPGAGVLEHARGEVENEETPGAARYAGYFKSLGHSLVFFTSPGNLVTYVVALVILTVGVIASRALFPLGVVAWFITTGWCLSFLMNVVLSSAGGEDDLPKITLTEGVLEDVIVPFFKMVATGVLALVPYFIFLWTISLAEQARPPGSAAAVAAAGGPAVFDVRAATTSIMGLVMMFGGAFAWPMLVLVVAVGGVRSVLRLDLIVMTVIKSFPAYLVTVLAVYACMALMLGFDRALRALAAESAGGGRSLALTLVGPILVEVVELYVWIVAMRAIGLYYHHFKHRFAWSWG
jgi:hypothetical protein